MEDVLLRHMEEFETVRLQQFGHYLAVLVRSDEYGHVFARIFGEKSAGLGCGYGREPRRVCFPRNQRVGYVRS